MSGYKIDNSTSGAFAHPEGGTVEFAYEAGTWAPSGDLDALALDSLVAGGLAEITDAGKPKNVTAAKVVTTEDATTTAPEPDADDTDNTEAQ